MSLFTEFELQVLDVLVAPLLGASTLDTIVQEARFVSFEFSICGYFLTVAHESVPKERTVCSDPMTTGRLGDADYGFVVFLENGELTFECYNFDEPLPENFRDLPVDIGPANRPRAVRTRA